MRSVAVYLYYMASVPVYYMATVTCHVRESLVNSLKINITETVDSLKVVILPLGHVVF